MDARYEITGTALPALPGSQPITDLLRAQQAPQLLRLGRRQSRRLQVVQGRLWLTQDGRHEDVLLVAGQQWLLQGPGRFHLGALGPEDCRFAWLPEKASQGSSASIGTRRCHADRDGLQGALGSP